MRPDSDRMMMFFVRLSSSPRGDEIMSFIEGLFPSTADTSSQDDKLMKTVYQMSRSINQFKV